ncbi:MULTISPECIES: putative T7SS-secreted protein [Streptomyces]|uniref:Putative T7SS secretion signal domain-containing protein n=1 Tax=Streptomyces antimycoticus TaxID=68175 RepID=A0ABD5JKJ3_9ACTN|nr:MULTISPECIES: hypothetical protein [Streptomyces]MEE4588580.1 hypothetical protein [Streptomyces sp. DSM 41602]RSS42997.1 hypothetical protein EF902_19375 [Streptomyces sp. WAC05858]WTA84407.1 hypothetical protein OG751_33535 [Streptomyces antimycoticus]
MDPAARNAGLANAWVEKALGWGTGELELGQTEEPKELIHGDASKLRSNASQLRGLANGLAAVGEGLRKLNSQEIKGETADAFRKRVSAEPKKWFQVAHACEQASGALTDVAHTVEWAQRQAQEAIDTYGRGKRASERAREAHNAKVDAYNKAVDAYNSKPSSSDTECAAPPKAPGAFHDPGAADMETAQEILAAARRQRNAAHDRAQTSIQGTYDQGHGEEGASDPATLLDTLAGITDSEEYKKYEEIKKDIMRPLKVLGIAKGIEAVNALFTGTSSELLARPWKTMTGLKGLAEKLRIPFSGRIPLNNPGTGALDKVVLPLSVVTGLKQVIKPDHGGAQGWVDRAMGGGQAAGAASILLTTEATAAAVPVVGWTVLGVTGAYFLGSWVADKWGDDIAAGAKSAWNATSHAVSSTVNSTVDTTVNAVLHPSGALKTAGHVVDGTVDSVKKLKFW